MKLAEELLIAKMRLDRVKEAEETKSIPIILLTAKAQESDKFWGKETGADEYLTKPYVIELLLKKIRDLLGKIQTP